MEHYREQHQKNFERTGPAWVEELRQTALKRFEAMGYPNSKQESWKYTSLKPLTGISFHLGEEYQPTHLNYDQLECVRFGKLQGVRLTFVNGHFAPKFSTLPALPAGVRVSSLKEALQKEPELLKKYLGKQLSDEGEPFIALNTAFLDDGALIHLAPGTVLDHPIELFYFSLAHEKASISHPRNLILAESGAQATIIENYAGRKTENPYFSNAITEIVAGEGSVIRHYKVQDEFLGAFHLSALGIRQERESSVSSFNISLGANLARLWTRSLMDAEGADCTLNGLYLVHGHQHVDNQTYIDHAKPHCTSNELYKGILGDQAEGVFNGHILVRPDAQQTNSNLTNKNLLLSRDALINTKPLLEIFANDVKCSHGATIGRLDKSQVYYLRSRGIAEPLARNLLTYAFASEVLHEMKVKALKTHLEEILLNRLHVGELSVEGEA